MYMHPDLEAGANPHLEAGAKKKKLTRRPLLDTTTCHVTPCSGAHAGQNAASMRGKH